MHLIVSHSFLVADG